MTAPSTPSTPGFCGYVGALLLGSLVWSVGIWVVHPNSDVGPFGALVVFVLAATVFGLGVPFLVLGLPLVVVHLACRRVAAQRAHVAWTAVAYLLPAAVASPWMGARERALALAVAPAMAVGRAAVIPSVRRRAAPVDLDFRPTA